MPPTRPNTNERRAGNCPGTGWLGAPEIPTNDSLPATAIRQLQHQAEEFVRAAKAPWTLRAYRSDWDHFTRWCNGHGMAALPASAETVALYLTSLAATHKPATMTRRLTAITTAHQIAGHASPATMQQPAVSETLKGIRHTLGTDQTCKAAVADPRHPPHARRLAR